MAGTLQSLNDQFALSGQLHFGFGPGGLVVAEIDNAYAKAIVALQGAHLISFQPHHQPPLLWASTHSRYQMGQPIRGGIPLVWPWFGPHPTDPSKPAHGFARTALWSVSESSSSVDGATRLRLSLTESEYSRALWPYSFQLELVISVSAELQTELIMHNLGESPFTCGAALHSYFSVSDVAGIAVHGLAGCTYLDKVDGNRPKIQAGPLTIAAETDRVYLDTTATCLIEDPAWGRQIQIAKSGSRSTVIWNPWVDKARQLADFGDEEYRGMVCVETANALEDVVTIAAGGEHRLRAVISSQPL